MNAQPAEEKVTDSDLREREWRAIETIRAPHYENLSHALQGFFRLQLRGILKVLEPESAKMADFSNLFDFDKWVRAFMDAVSEVIRFVLETGVLAGQSQAGLTTAQIQAGLPIDYEVLLRQVSRSELVNHETEKQLMALIIELTENGTSQRGMQSAVRQLFNDYENYRVDRITNTIVVGSFEAGQLAAWKEGGVTHKSWIPAIDDRVRGDHDLREHPELSNMIPINDPFILGTERAELQHPGDPAGGAKQVINCRCTMGPGDEE